MGSRAKIMILKKNAILTCLLELNFSVVGIIEFDGLFIELNSDRCIRWFFHYEFAFLTILNSDIEKSSYESLKKL